MRGIDSSWSIWISLCFYSYSSVSSHFPSTWVIKYNLEKRTETERERERVNDGVLILIFLSEISLSLSLSIHRTIRLIFVASVFLIISKRKNIIILIGSVYFLCIDVRCFLQAIISPMTSSSTFSVSFSFPRLPILSHTVLSSQLLSRK